MCVTVMHTKVCAVLKLVNFSMFCKLYDVLTVFMTTFKIKCDDYVFIAYANTLCGIYYNVACSLTQYVNIN